MSQGTYAAASFRLLRDATAAIDWFRNQRIPPQFILVAVQPPGEPPRKPRRGDDLRTDLEWIVALDLTNSALPPAVAKDALKRQGGKVHSRALDISQIVAAIRGAATLG